MVLEKNLPLSLRLIRQFEFPKKLGICERLYGERLAKLGECITTCANGVTWRLDLSDVGHRWMVYGYYEGGVGIRYAEEKLQDGGVYLDSGANIGQWISYLSSIPKVRTYAFEPVPSENEWLKECLSFNSDWEVKVVSLALGEAQSELKMQCSGSRSTFRTDWYQNQNNDVISVPVERLDTYLAREQVTEVKFWKLDVEGHEYEALKGAEYLLKNKAIETIYFECHPDNFAKIKSYLASLDYGVYRLSSQGLASVESHRPSETENFVAEPLEA